MAGVVGEDHEFHRLAGFGVDLLVVSQGFLNLGEGSAEVLYVIIDEDDHIVLLVEYIIARFDVHG